MTSASIRLVLSAARIASVSRERLRNDWRWFVALYAPAVLVSWSGYLARSSAIALGQGGARS